MKIFTKRHFGLLLICISVLAAILSFMVVPHRAFADSSGPGGPIFWGVDWELSWQYKITILACGAIGLIFVAASLRKPPKLRK